MRSKDSADSVKVAHAVDLALDAGCPPDDICKALRTEGCRPLDIVMEMTRAWRIFAPDFRRGCSDENRRFVYTLSFRLPNVVRDNYFKQEWGLRRIEARQRASFQRGRVNISADAPFDCGDRLEVHDIFSRKSRVAEYARSLAALPNLRNEDVARTIWAGRVYQDDFFRAAPAKLKLKMLECLHMTDPAIAQPFVAQMLQDRRLPRRYRTLVWTEGVLRPHMDIPNPSAAVRDAYVASCAGEKWKEYPVNDLFDLEHEEWSSKYAKGDSPAPFDMQRTLRGLKLSRQMIDELTSLSCLNILSYYLRERREEFEEAYSFSEFAGLVCANGKCTCVLALLGILDELEPGVLADFCDANGANLFEYALYRCCDSEPKTGSWIRMCLMQKPELAEIIQFLRESGCDETEANSVGIAWTDIEDAALERFDGNVFRAVLAEDRMNADDVFRDFEEFPLPSRNGHGDDDYDMGFADNMEDD